MITRMPTWQTLLADALRTGEELLDHVGVDPEDAGLSAEAARLFRCLVPRGFADRMRCGDSRDPLLLQVLPMDKEVETEAEKKAQKERKSPPDGAAWTADPLAEAEASPVPGVLHKYAGRVLLVTTGACAVHCRYCFRRHFPYAEHRSSDPGWERALDYVASDPTLHEVILSGGDPLTLSDDKLSGLAERLAAIPHVERLRLHTRLPVVLPERVDDRLLGWLAGTRLRPVVVLHANHAREIDASVAAATERLRRAGVPLLNQSVLLRGVNDSVAALEDLSLALFGAGVIPYYLHVLDRVEGAAHYAVAEETARRLVRRLAERASGYLVPRLVREDSGAPAKTSVYPPR